MAKTDIITTADLKAAMTRHWSAPAYALIWEVGDATGGRHNRNADAVIMGLYPSRGIHLEGVEIKTHRSDWRREMKNPAKAEAVSRYCDMWWVHATPGVVKEDELPQGWGLREYDGRVWRTVVKAEMRSPEPVSREFLAALLRRSDQQQERVAKEMAQGMLSKEIEDIEKRVAAGIAQRTSRSAAMASIAEEFEAALGMDPAELIRNGEVRIAARMTAAIMKQDLHNPWGGLSYLIKSMRDLADRTSDALQEIGVDVPAPDERFPRATRSRKA